MKVGYARVSTIDQNLDMQIDALQKIDCKKIFQEKISGTDIGQEALKEALIYLRPGDTLIVWKLDRLSRSMKSLISITNDLQSRGINFISLQEGFDTSTATGKLIFHVFAALAEFERNIIRERTIAGLKSARMRGRVGGRPKILDMKMLQNINNLSQNKDMRPEEIWKMLSISKTAYYKGLKESIKNGL